MNDEGVTVDKNWQNVKKCNQSISVIKLFSHISIVCLHDECVNGTVQVAEHLRHDGAEDQDEEQHGCGQQVAQHPLKLFKFKNSDQNCLSRFSF